MLKNHSDNDYPVYNSPDKLVNQISVDGARGMLIESQGPSWFYGTGSEHSVMYNYQLNNAKNLNTALLMSQYLLIRKYNADLYGTYPNRDPLLPT